MALFGVELNVQLNRIVHQTRLRISNYKTKIFLRDIAASFANYDTSNSGVIHIEHFQEALQLNRIIYKKWEYQVILKAYPADFDKGYLFWTSYLSALVTPMDQQRLDLVEAIWSFIDSREEGSLHYQELIELFNIEKFIEYRDGFKSEEQLKNEMLHRLRFDEKARLSKQQFVAFYQDLNVNFPGWQAFSQFVASHWRYPLKAFESVKPQQIKALVRQFRFKLIQKTTNTHDQFLLKKVFDQFDQDRCGKLTARDLHEMSIKLSIPLQERLLIPLLGVFDKNRSGAVEYDEFKNFLFFDPYPI